MLIDAGLDFRVGGFALDPSSRLGTSPYRRRSSGYSLPSIAEPSCILGEYLGWDKYPEISRIAFDAAANFRGRRCDELPGMKK